MFFGEEPDAMVTRLDDRWVTEVMFDGVAGFKQWPMTACTSESMEEII